MSFVLDHLLYSPVFGPKVPDSAVRIYFVALGRFQIFAALSVQHMWCHRIVLQVSNCRFKKKQPSYVMPASLRFNEASMW